MKRNKMTTMPGLPTFRDRGIEIVYVLEYTMPKSLDSIIRAYDNEKDALLESFKQIDKGSKEAYVAELELNDWETLDNQNAEHGLWIGDLAKRDCFVFSNGKPRFTKAWLFRDEIDTELERFVEEEEYDEVYYHILWNPEKAEIELTEEYKKELLEDIKKLNYIKYLDEDYNFQGLCDTVIDNLWNGLERDEIRFEVYNLQYAPDFNDDIYNTNTLEEMLEHCKKYGIDLSNEEVCVISKLSIDGHGFVADFIKTYDASELAERE